MPDLWVFCGTNGSCYHLGSCDFVFLLSVVKEVVIVGSSYPAAQTHTTESGDAVFNATAGESENQFMFIFTILYYVSTSNHINMLYKDLIQLGCL